MPGESLEEQLCWRALRLWGARMDPIEGETLLPFLDDSVSIKVQQTALQVIANWKTGPHPCETLPEELRQRIVELARRYLNDQAPDQAPTRALQACLLVACELYGIDHPDTSGDWAKPVRHQAGINHHRIQACQEEPKTPKPPSVWDVVRVAGEIQRELKKGKAHLNLVLEAELDNALMDIGIAPQAWVDKPKRKVNPCNRICGTVSHMTGGAVAQASLVGLAGFMWGLPLASVGLLALLGAVTFVVTWPLSKLL